MPVSRHDIMFHAAFGEIARGCRGHAASVSWGEAFDGDVSWKRRWGEHPVAIIMPEQWLGEEEPSLLVPPAGAESIVCALGYNGVLAEETSLLLVSGNSRLPGLPFPECRVLWDGRKGTCPSVLSYDEVIWSIDGNGSFWAQADIPIDGDMAHLLAQATIVTAERRCRMVLSTLIMNLLVNGETVMGASIPATRLPEHLPTIGDFSGGVLESPLSSEDASPALISAANAILPAHDAFSAASLDENGEVAGAIRFKDFTTQVLLRAWASAYPHLLHEIYPGLFGDVGKYTADDGRAFRDEVRRLAKKSGIDHIVDAYASGVPIEILFAD